MEEADIIELANKKIIEFAKSQNSKIWHQMVLDWNWDCESNGFLDWLIDNPKTDKATILMIYWKSIPNNEFDNRKIIEERYNTYYSEQNIAFDPQNDRGTNWIDELDNYYQFSNKLPEIMLQKLVGLELESLKGFDEGIPEKIADEISELYDELDE